MQPAGNSEVKEVDSFMYLDAYVTKDGGGTVDTSASFRRPDSMLKVANISRRSKSLISKA